MTPEQLTQIEKQELANAWRLQYEAWRLACDEVDNLADITAASVAILVRAVELSTPELSAKLRAALFLEQE